MQTMCTVQCMGAHSDAVVWDGGNEVEEEPARLDVSGGNGAGTHDKRAIVPIPGAKVNNNVQNEANILSNMNTTAVSTGGDDMT